MRQPCNQTFSANSGLILLIFHTLIIFTLGLVNHRRFTQQQEQTIILDKTYILSPNETANIDLHQLLYNNQIYGDDFQFSQINESASVLLDQGVQLSISQSIAQQNMLNFTQAIQTHTQLENTNYHFFLSESYVFVRRMDMENQVTFSQDVFIMFPKQRCHNIWAVTNNMRPVLLLDCDYNISSSFSNRQDMVNENNDNDGQINQAKDQEKSAKLIDNDINNIQDGQKRLGQGIQASTFFAVYPLNLNVRSNAFINQSVYQIINLTSQLPPSLTNCTRKLFVYAPQYTKQQNTKMLLRYCSYSSLVATQPNLKNNEALQYIIMLNNILNVSIQSYSRFPSFSNQSLSLPQPQFESVSYFNTTSPSVHINQLRFLNFLGSINFIDVQPNSMGLGFLCVDTYTVIAQGFQIGKFYPISNFLTNQNRHFLCYIDSRDIKIIDITDYQDIFLTYQRIMPFKNYRVFNLVITLAFFVIQGEIVQKVITSPYEAGVKESYGDYQGNQPSQSYKTEGGTYINDKVGKLKGKDESVKERSPNNARKSNLNQTDNFDETEGVINQNSRFIASFYRLSNRYALHTIEEYDGNESGGQDYNMTLAYYDTNYISNLFLIIFPKNFSVQVNQISDANLMISTAKYMEKNQLKEQQLQISNITLNVSMKNVFVNQQLLNQTSFLLQFTLELEQINGFIQVTQQGRRIFEKMLQSGFDTYHNYLQFTITNEFVGPEINYRSVEEEEMQNQIDTYVEYIQSYPVTVQWKSNDRIVYAQLIIQSRQLLMVYQKVENGDAACMAANNMTEPVIDCILRDSQQPKCCLYSTFQLLCRYRQVAKQQNMFFNCEPHSETLLINDQILLIQQINYTSYYFLVTRNSSTLQQSYLIYNSANQLILPNAGGYQVAGNYTIADTLLEDSLVAVMNPEGTIVSFLSIQIFSNNQSFTFVQNGQFNISAVTDESSKKILKFSCKLINMLGIIVFEDSNYQLFVVLTIYSISQQDQGYGIIDQLSMQPGCLFEVFQQNYIVTICPGNQISEYIFGMDYQLVLSRMYPLYDYVLPDASSFQVTSDSNFVYVRALQFFNDKLQVADKILMFNPLSPTTSLLAHALTLDMAVNGRAFIFSTKFNISGVLFQRDDTLNLLLASNQMRVYANILIKQNTFFYQNLSVLLSVSNAHYGSNIFEKLIFNASLDSYLVYVAKDQKTVTRDLKFNNDYTNNYIVDEIPVELIKGPIQSLTIYRTTNSNYGIFDVTLLPIIQLSNHFCDYIDMQSYYGPMNDIVLLSKGNNHTFLLLLSTKSILLLNGSNPLQVCQQIPNPVYLDQSSVSPSPFQDQQQDLSSLKCQILRDDTQSYFFIYCGDVPFIYMISYTDSFISTCSIDKTTTKQQQQIKYERQYTQEYTDYDSMASEDQSNQYTVQKFNIDQNFGEIIKIRVKADNNFPDDLNLTTFTVLSTLQKQYAERIIRIASIINGTLIEMQRIDATMLNVRVLLTFDFKVRFFYINEIQLELLVLIESSFIYFLAIDYEKSFQITQQYTYGNDTLQVQDLQLKSIDLLNMTYDQNNALIYLSAIIQNDTCIQEILFTFPYSTPGNLPTSVGGISNFYQQQVLSYFQNYDACDGYESKVAYTDPTEGFDQFYLVRICFIKLINLTQATVQTIQYEIHLYRKNMSYNNIINDGEIPSYNPINMNQMEFAEPIVPYVYKYQDGTPHLLISSYITLFADYQLRKNYTLMIRKANDIQYYLRRFQLQVEGYNNNSAVNLTMNYSVYSGQSSRLSNDTHWVWKLVLLILIFLIALSSWVILFKIKREQKRQAIIQQLEQDIILANIQTPEAEQTKQNQNQHHRLSAANQRVGYNLDSCDDYNEDQDGKSPNKRSNSLSSIHSINDF